LEQLKLRYVTFLALLFISLALVAVIVAYLFSTRFSRNLSRPVLQLSRAAEKIADGDFTQRVTTTAVGEIKTLVDSFNRMSGQLDEMTSRLAQTERVAAWRSIARRFAHELKNPLQPILVSLYRIEKKLQGSKDFDQVRQPLKAASEELKHLVDLADRFSQLAKLPPPSVKDVNLGELLKSIAQLYEPLLAPFDFRLELPEEEVQYRLDPTYFREALHNLLQNAVDASSPGGLIELKLAVGSDTVNILVTDTGCGMPSEVAASARIPYFTTKEKGDGLGLAIVEKTVNELGGRVLIESREGQGTTATIELPRERK
jgi:nitrogen fixation/metabolism regulation signal transduction histidine kinase